MGFFGKIADVRLGSKYATLNFQKTSRKTSTMELNFCKVVRLQILALQNSTPWWIFL